MGGIFTPTFKRARLTAKSLAIPTDVFYGPWDDLCQAKSGEMETFFRNEFFEHCNGLVIGMDFLDLTLPQIQANLALDEALLHAADAGELGEVLRIWEVPSFAVVIGRGSRVAEEVHKETCERLGVPIVRRCSGGCAVVIGPGCLLYSLVFDLNKRSRWRKVDCLHHDVRQKLVDALRQMGVDAVAAGTSDLASISKSTAECIAKKISGNSVRYARNHVLYHGTLLYAFDLAQMGRLLKQPTRQPEYRHGRSHEAFVTNVPLKRSDLVNMLCRVWDTHRQLPDWPRGRVQALLEERYSRLTWHYER